MTIPFSLQPRNAHQDLIDFLLMIPHCIALSGIKGSLGRFFSVPIPQSVDVSVMQQQAAHLLQQLDDWAGNHPHLCCTQPANLVTTIDFRVKFEDQGQLTPDSPKLIMPDTFVALTAATYKATRLILVLLVDKVTGSSNSSRAGSVSESSTRSSPSSVFEDAMECSRAILQISEYFESKHPVGFDFMRSVFPLVVVAILSPEEKQRQTARQTLNRWGESRGLGGLCGAWVDI